MLWGLLVGIGTGSVGLVASATIVNRWFDKNRGTVMGVLTASNATGQLVFLPLFGWLVTAPGWRAEVLFIAAVCAVLAPLTLLVLREYPSDLNIPVLGAAEVTAPVRATGNPFFSTLGALRDGFRSGDFWLLGGSFFICGASTNALIGTHLVPACGDHGIPEIQAAGLLAAMIFGWVFTGHQLGAGMAAYLAGLARSHTGSYDSAFIASGTLCMIAAAMVLFVGRPAATPAPAFAAG